MSQAINQLFAELPKKTADYYKHVNSLSGKSETEALTNEQIEVFLQPTGGVLRDGIVPGTYQTMFLDASLISPNVVDFGDAFVINSRKYSVIGIELFDFGTDVNAFYELTLESIKV